MLWDTKPCAPLALRGGLEEAPLGQGAGQGGLHITCRHKIQQLVKGVEESGFHFAFGCVLVTLVDQREGSGMTLLQPFNT